MRLSRPFLAALALSVLGSGLGQAQQQEGDAKRLSALQRQVAELQKQNQTLSRALVEAKKTAKTATVELEKISLELEALGTHPLGEGDQRLIQAVADRKVLEERLGAVETAALNLTDSVRDYLKHALAADPDSRVRVESSIRELDLTLGLRHKPRPQAELGSLHEAKIKSIDSQSGLLVLNAGEKQQVRIGMTFRIMRGNRQIAEAIIAGVRPDISGALVTKLEDTNNAVRLGDIATIKTQ